LIKKSRKKKMVSHNAVKNDRAFAFHTPYSTENQAPRARAPRLDWLNEEPDIQTLTKAHEL